jgi:hypothetical protein
MDDSLQKKLFDINEVVVIKTMMGGQDVLEIMKKSGFPFVLHVRL